MKTLHLPEVWTGFGGWNWVFFGFCLVFLGFYGKFGFLDAQTRKKPGETKKKPEPSDNVNRQEKFFLCFRSIFLV
jgi:hypothetical protein